MRLQGKIAIITGASRSIGRAVALRFAREGAKVVVNFRSNVGLAEAVVQEIRAQGGEAFALGADVSRPDEVRRLAEETAGRYGTVHILVNNAAIDPRKPWMHITPENWDEVMATNVRSQFLCAQAVFPFMRQQGYGKIVNVSSVTFHTGQKGYVHYVASKGAIVGFTRALAREVGEYKVTVNCLALGAVLTETEVEKLGSVEAQQQAEIDLKAAQSIPRRQQIEDVEGAFLYLASPDSDFVTGQTLNVDGGWMMH